MWRLIQQKFCFAGQVSKISKLLVLWLFMVLDGRKGSSRLLAGCKGTVVEGLM